MATATLTDSAVSTQNKSKAERLPVTVEKPSPYTYELSYLTAVDPNPLPSSKTLLSQSLTERNQILQQIARDGAQSLLTTLLTTCAITSTSDGLTMNLPHASQPLPRWKPLPKPKAPTTWEKFARKKGIGKFGGSLKGGASLEDRRKNLVYDEEKGEWVKKWGYKGKNKDAETQWLVELDDAAVQREKEGFGGQGRTIRGESRRERKENIKRQERKQRNNDRKSRKGKA
ncbi:hypothetical protein B0A52_04416 [Exophiala mesophila]|uniref:Ribosome biogenesis regulatory protein n=1 Tax=Exophiala mesophila TaxID=212818 RepID=A0A438N9B5_EXOME|nr:hypothetical protein B0A52_04416 [Exophiala mesophila]